MGEKEKKKQAIERAREQSEREAVEAHRVAKEAELKYLSTAMLEMKRDLEERQAVERREFAEKARHDARKVDSILEWNRRQMKDVHAQKELEKEIEEANAR